MKKGIRLAAAALITVLCVGTAGCGIGLIREAVSRGSASDTEVTGDSGSFTASGEVPAGTGNEARTQACVIWCSQFSPFLSLRGEV